MTYSSQHNRNRRAPRAEWGARPVQRLTMRDQVYGALLDGIVAGSLPPGAALPTTWLAEKLGVSRTPVREAIERLLQDGLAIRTPSGTVVVHAPSLEDFREFFEIRGVLEGLGARLAAAKATVGDLQALRSNQQRLRDLVVEGGLTPPEGLRLNGEFHGRVFTASGNQRLAELMRTLGAVVNAKLLEQIYIHADPASTVADHAAILDALQLQDPDAAEAAARVHVFNAGEAMLAYLSEHSPLEVETAPASPGGMAHG